jgi:hypothetical protein
MIFAVWFVGATVFGEALRWFALEQSLAKDSFQDGFSNANFHTPLHFL